MEKTMRGFAPVAALLAAGALAPAHAQAPCPDGKTFSGTCVKSELGESVRKQVFVASQPKISHTAPPVLPSEDGIYAISRDYHELRTIYGIGATDPTICMPTRTNPC